MVAPWLAIPAAHAADAVPAPSDSAGPALGTPLQQVTRLPVDGEPKEMPLAEAAPLPANAPAAREADVARTTPSMPRVTSSPLASAESNAERSEQMEQVARQADRQTRHGLELAGRGAHFAARAEFLGALRLLAEGLDNDRRTSMHGRALAAALTALKEAEDFLPGSPRLESGRDVAGLIAAHATPVLKSAAGDVPPMTALRCHLTFAQEQLAVAAGHEVAGSMALRSLGKLHEALAASKTTLEPAAQSKAMVFYQAALLVYPANSMAANDLGVLLARAGNMADARGILEYSASLAPEPVTWRNLAVVYRQLQQPRLADDVARRAAILEQRQLAQRRTRLEAARQMVRWVDPEQFAETSTTMPGAPALAAETAASVHQRPASGDGRVAVVAERDPRAGDRSADAAHPVRRPSTAERMTWGSSAYQR
ncbi:MAG: hypothetical protein ABFC63_07015 [Thermoguttaceae bacterium]